MADSSGELIVAIVAIGMGAAFFGADRESPTSRSLALALCLLGITTFLGVLNRAGFLAARSWLWPPIFSLSGAAVFIAMYEWVLRIRRTQMSAKKERDRRDEMFLRIAQALALLYGLLGASFPETHDVFMAHRISMAGYYLNAVPLFLSLGLAIVPLIRYRFDQPEGIRLLALVVATPFLMSGIILPQWQAVGTALGEMIFLAGAVRYHVIQGQRAQFLGRFLSPQLANLVSRRGLTSAMQQSRVQLSVVASDLRGFTAFSETAAPEEVTQLLREYYDTLSEVVTEFGGTIKDLAGDGILVLVGAPIALPDHAARAIAMALKMREYGARALLHWHNMGLELGLGIGVASGYVTVGVIGGTTRLEYVAVGPAVNLAARLCDRAQAGQVLLDQRTVALAGDSGANQFTKLEPAELKGFARPVAMFAVERS